MTDLKKSAAESLDLARIQVQGEKMQALQAKVEAVNRANEYGAKLYADLRAVFTPLVGKKILKADGSLLAKYAPLVPEFPSSTELHVFRHRSDYSLAWTVKTCVPLLPYSCVYHEVTVYVGDLRGDVLEKLAIHPFVGRTDYTAEEIVGKRLVYERAKRAADDARNDLYPFGEYDR